MVQVLRVGDQPCGGVGRPADPRTELGGRELAHLRHPGARRGAGPLATGSGGLGRVEPVRVVDHGPLVGGAQQVGLGVADGVGAAGREVEDLVLRQGF